MQITYEMHQPQGCGANRRNKMSKYLMTIKINTQVGYWEVCKSSTLAGAKREATKYYAQAIKGSTILIAEREEYEDGVTQDFIVASKQNYSNARWRNFA